MSFVIEAVGSGWRNHANVIVLPLETQTVVFNASDGLRELLSRAVEAVHKQFLYRRRGYFQLYRPKRADGRQQFQKDCQYFVTYRGTVILLAPIVLVARTAHDVDE